MGCKTLIGGPIDNRARVCCGRRVQSRRRWSRWNRCGFKRWIRRWYRCGVDNRGFSRKCAHVYWIIRMNNGRKWGKQIKDGGDVHSIMMGRSLDLRQGWGRNNYACWCIGRCRNMSSRFIWGGLGWGDGMEGKINARRSCSWRLRGGFTNYRWQGCGGLRMNIGIWIFSNRRNRSRKTRRWRVQRAIISRGNNIVIMIIRV